MFQTAGDDRRTTATLGEQQSDCQSTQVLYTADVGKERQETAGFDVNYVWDKNLRPSTQVD